MRTFNSAAELGEAIKDKEFPANSFFATIRNMYSTYGRCCKCVRVKKRDELNNFYAGLKELTPEDVALIKVAIKDNEVQFSNSGVPLLKI